MFGQISTLERTTDEPLAVFAARNNDTEVLKCELDQGRWDERCLYEAAQRGYTDALLLCLRQTQHIHEACVKRMVEFLIYFNHPGTMLQCFLYGGLVIEPWMAYMAAFLGHTEMTRLCIMVRTDLPDERVRRCAVNHPEVLRVIEFVGSVDTSGACV